MNIRSQERKKQQTSHTSEQRNSELLAEFECPVCYNLLAPPLQILQCSAGHVLCSACKDQGIESCPTCRNKITGRARHMENIARVFFADLNRFGLLECFCRFDTCRNKIMGRAHHMENIARHILKKERKLKTEVI